MSASFRKILYLYLLCTSSLVFHLSVAALPCLNHPPKSDGSLSFLVVGDWGRKGSYNQSEVAFQMGIIGEKLDIDFVISTGDNFYEDGLQSVDDPAFDESFSNIYTAPSLERPWYTVLGNHDYRGNVEAQLSSILREKDKRWLCFRNFILNAEKLVDVIFVDTTPFVDEYFVNPEDNSYDWKGISCRKNYLSDLLKEVDFALRNSRAIWKIVVGHHTIKSAGHHGVTKELIDALLPILQANKVDFYINGHDHCLEHISSVDGNIQYLTSGGGSKSWRGDVQSWNSEEMKFYFDGQGFMSMKLTQMEANFAFYDIFGAVLHNYTISKELHLPH